MYEGNYYCIRVDEVRKEKGTKISSPTKTTDILSNMEGNVYDILRGSMIL